jgi:hypothetical protein
LLEIWVFIHGSLTALIQPGIGWQIFSYGFMAMFLLNQIYQTHVGQHKGILIGLYGLFAGWMYWGFRQDKKYFRATFIPVAEYMCLYFCIGIGMMTSVLLRYVPARQHKQWIIISTYIGVSIVLTIGLAYVLAGNLLVYNDY